MIELDQVTKRYGHQVVVDGVSLTIAAGGITSIIGANGAGKSTLLSVIARLLPRDSGRVRVGSLDVSACDTRELAKVLSILKQDNHLSVRMSVRDLVAFGRYPHSGGRLSDHDKAVIATAIDYLDLNELADRYLDEMSGGQRQRAFVAMVLAQDTDVILLDEPLNNLDMPHARAMMVRLRRAADELGKTIVMVIHDINYAACWSDRIIAMKTGKLCRQGAPEEIMTTAALRDIYGIDIEVYSVAGRPLAHYYR